MTNHRINAPAATNAAAAHTITPQPATEASSSVAAALAFIPSGETDQTRDRPKTNADASTTKAPLAQTIAVAQPPPC